ncbi:MAG: hypothetical protein GXN93_03400 [Candidatus Diapherotrites archaeon]|nr:hypothetical protein [Candidatus Diapherotrites archaeon]
MGAPKFSFTPPQPFRNDDLSVVLAKLESLEREIIFIKRKLAELEGKPVARPPAPAPKVVPKDRPIPAAAGAVYLLDHVDLGNVRVIETLIDWVQFLLSKVGQEGIDDVIQYYQEINWITEDVANILRSYARGMRVEGSQGYMMPEDHAKSLDYITRIKEAMK